MEEIDILDSLKLYNGINFINIFSIRLIDVYPTNAGKGVGKSRTNLRISACALSLALLLLNLSPRVSE